MSINTKKNKKMKQKIVTQAYLKKIGWREIETSTYEWWMVKDINESLYLQIHKDKKCDWLTYGFSIFKNGKAIFQMNDKKAFAVDLIELIIKTRVL